MSDHYVWTFNVSIWRNSQNRKLGIEFVVWIGDRQYCWSPLHPLKYKFKIGPYGTQSELSLFRSR